MRRSSDFGATVRRGRRAGSGTVVVHVLPALPDELVAGSRRVGFVVSKAVGGAVVRNRTKRRLRALMRPLLPSAWPGHAGWSCAPSPPRRSLRPSALGVDLDPRAATARERRPTVGAAVRPSRSRSSGASSGCPRRPSSCCCGSGSWSSPRSTGRPAGSTRPAPATRSRPSTGTGWSAAAGWPCVGSAAATPGTPAASTSFLRRRGRPPPPRLADDEPHLTVPAATVADHRPPRRAA